MSMDSLFQEEYKTGVSKGMGASYEKTNRTAFDIGSGLVEEKEEVVEKKVYKSTVKVIILAGSFAPKLTTDIIDEMNQYLTSGGRFDGISGAGGDSRHMGSASTWIRGAHGKEHVSYGNVKMADTTAFESMLILLRKVDRLFPIEQNVFVVTNDANYSEMMDVANETDVQFPRENVLKNGSLHPKNDPVSLLSDLELAIDHFKINTPVLVIGAEVVLYPDFNLQRVIEHSYICGKSIIAYSKLVANEHVVAEAKDKIATMEVQGNSSINELVKFNKSAIDTDNACMACPIFYLPSKNLSLVKDYNAVKGKAGELNDFYDWMVGQTATLALDIGFGYFDLRTLGNLKFAQSFFEFYRMEKKAINAAMRISDTDSSLDLKTTFSGMGDASKYAISESQVLGLGNLTPQLENLCRDFIRRYFIEKSASLTGKMDYKIPSTFYMTSYRRQVSHADMQA